MKNLSRQCHFIQGFGLWWGNCVNFDNVDSVKKISVGVVTYVTFVVLQSLQKHAVTRSEVSAVVILGKYAVLVHRGVEFSYEFLPKLWTVSPSAPELKSLSLFSCNILNPRCLPRSFAFVSSELMNGILNYFSRLSKSPPFIIITFYEVLPNFLSRYSLLTYLQFLSELATIH